jgi:hypothetical protein
MWNKLHSFVYPSLIVGFLWGTIVSFINISYIPNSPIFISTWRHENSFRLAICSVIKGSIYGTFWPITIPAFAIDSFKSEEDFKKHIIPCSKYGRPSPGGGV